MMDKGKYNYKKLLPFVGMKFLQLNDIHQHTTIGDHKYEWAFDVLRFSDVILKRLVHLASSPYLSFLVKDLQP